MDRRQGGRSIEGSIDLGRRELSSVPSKPPLLGHIARVKWASPAVIGPTGRSDPGMANGCPSQCRGHSLISMAHSNICTNALSHRPDTADNAITIIDPPGIRYFLRRSRVRAAFFAAILRPAAPFVRAALRAASERSAGERRAATHEACVEDMRLASRSCPWPSLPWRRRPPPACAANRPRRRDRGRP